MLLGAFSTYTELTARVDKAVRHWQNDFYIQDNWRATSRLTLGLGRAAAAQRLGLTRSTTTTPGSSPISGRRTRRRACTRWSAPRCRGQPGLRGGQPADDRSGQSRRVLPGRRSTATSCPARGNQINGVSTDGIPGAKPGTYFTVPMLVAAPRVGFGVECDGGRQDRAPRVVGDLLQLPAIDGHRRLPLRRRLPGLVQQSGPLGDVRRHRGRGQRIGATVQLVQSPVNVNIGGYDQPLAKSYNMNVAFQRDIGFNTVAEIAYVGNFQFEGGRTVDTIGCRSTSMGSRESREQRARSTTTRCGSSTRHISWHGSVTQFVPKICTADAQVQRAAAQRAAPR